MSRPDAHTETGIETPATTADTRAWPLLRQMTGLGLPIIISMAALIGLGVTDTLMVGLVSTLDLAALGIGANLYFIFTMMLVGLLSVVAPRVAWRRASGAQDRIREEVWQAGWLGLAAGGIVALAMTALVPFLFLLQLEADVETVAASYVRTVAFTLPLIGANLVLRSTLDGFGRTGLAMMISLFVFALNILLNYALVFGRLGFPQLGAQGAAYATCVVTVVQSLMAYGFVHWHRHMRGYRIFERFVWPRWSIIRTLLWLGLPAALAITLEESFFAASGFLVAPMGTVPLAAHQIAISIALSALVVPIGLGQAGAIVVGASLGAGQPAIARRQARLLLLLVAAAGLLFALLLYAVRAPLLSLFTRDAAVIALAMPVLIVAALQLLVDSVQLGSNIALKGYQDTMVPALLQTLSYWCVGFPLAWMLSHSNWLGGPWGVPGVWGGIATALAVAALLSSWRLNRVSRDFATGRRTLPAAG